VNVRHPRAFACREHAREIGEADGEIDQTEAADAAAHEVVRDDRLDRRPRQREVVVLPELGPGQNDEQQADLEEKRDKD
jgi:hypothetical protein